MTIECTKVLDGVELVLIFFLFRARLRILHERCSSPQAGFVDLDPLIRSAQKRAIFMCKPR